MRMHYSGRAVVNDKRGAAAVEFAMIAPPLAMLVFGILQYGVYFGVSHSMQQLTNDAARTAVAGLTRTERQQMVADLVKTHAKDFGFVRKERVGAAVTDEAGEIVVRTTYDASCLPIFALDGLVPMPPSKIETRASVRIGGF